MDITDRIDMELIDVGDTYNANFFFYFERNSCIYKNDLGFRNWELLELHTRT
jgi:hypothetical protein